MKDKASTNPGTASTNPGTGQAPNVQGEGDYESARKYNKDAKEFAQSGKVHEAARAAKPENEQQARAMEQAEQAGKSRAKEEDPQLRGKR